MANPYAPFPIMSPDNGDVLLSVEFAVGATGAVGTVTRGREMGTPVRNGVGDYSFPLREGWVALIAGDAFAVGALDATAGTNSKIIADSSTATSSPLVRFQFMRPDTGAAAEVANGDTVKCWLILKRYSAG